MLLKFYVATVMRALRSDRGEGVVPYVVLVALMAAAALLIAGLVSGVAQAWVTSIVDP